MTLSSIVQKLNHRRLTNAVPSKANSRGVRAAERRIKALELRKAGKTYDAIGKKLGITTQSAHALVMSALEQIRTVTAEDAAKVRELELERLTGIYEKLYPKRDDPRAADTLVRIAERRSRLLGLDAPTKLEVDDTGGLTDDERAARIASILDSARARKARPAPPGKQRVEPE